MKDFFVSYNKADRSWAEWIAWQLEEAGYTTVLQAWDFRPGSNFVLEMQRAAAGARQTIAVLSPDYLTALYTQPEWAAAFAQDPTGAKGKLLPVRVRECTPTGMLSQVVYIDLLGQHEVDCRETLLKGVRPDRIKPDMRPAFPGPPGRSVAHQPSFPGPLPRRRKWEAIWSPWGWVGLPVAAGAALVILSWTAIGVPPKATPTPRPDGTAPPTPMQAIPIPPTPIPRPGQIAFVSDRDGNQEIYVMAADGASQRNLTKNPGADISPSWKPGASKLVFVSNRDGDREIYSTSSDGSVLTRLTTNPSDDVSPSYSPEGNRVLFVSNRSGRYQIWSMAEDGTALRQETDVEGEVIGYALSADGSRIAFESELVRGRRFVWIANANGSGARRVTDPNHTSWNASLSPDSGTAIYASDRNGKAEVYARSLAGHGEALLTHNNQWNQLPSWSPKGDNIAWIASEEKLWGLYIMNRDGSGARRLLGELHDRDAPVWSADADRVIVTSAAGGQLDIYSIRPDGSGLLRLTTHPGNDYSPVWSR